MFKIKNNFFKKDQYDKIKKLVFDPDFAWYVQHGVSNIKNDDFFFTHTLFREDLGINSGYYSDIVEPFIKKLKLKKVFRVKLNLYTKTDKKVVHGYHVDRHDKHGVVLFFLNENNGQTIFRNRKVKSEDNTAVIFDGSLEHTSTTCTDKHYRITLNINYEL